MLPAPEPARTPVVWPLTLPEPPMLIVPVVEVASMPMPPVEVRAALVVIVVVPVVAEVSTMSPLTLPTVPPVSETVTLPLPVIDAATALVVPLSAPAVWSDIDGTAAEAGGLDTYGAGRHVVADIDGGEAVKRAGSDAYAGGA